MKLAFVNNNKIFAQNTFMLYLMTIAKYIFPLMLFPYLTRVLTPSNYGVITYMTSITSYLSIMIDFGFNFSATRKIAQNKGNEEKINKIFSAVIQGKIILALIGGGIVSLLVPFIDILKNNIVLTLLYYLSTVLLVFLPDFLYRGLEKMQGITVRYLLSKAVTTILTIILVKGPEDIALVPLMNMIGNLVAIVFTWIQIKHNFNVHLSWVKWSNIIKEIKESYTFFISTFASTAFTAANTAIIGIAHLSDAQIGYWGVAFQLISMVMSLYEPITSSIYPRMVVTKKFSLAYKIVAIIQPVILLGIIFCYFAAPILINIIEGSEYTAAVKVFRCMLPVLFFAFPAQMFGFPVLGVAGKEKLASRATVVAAIFHISGLILLLVANSFTLVTVAILRSCTEGIFMTVRIYYVWKNRSYLRSVSKKHEINEVIL